MPEEHTPTMREEEVTAAQIGAYWNALVRNQDVREIPLEPDLDTPAFRRELDRVGE